jgi:RimJ/RimL family protein N-acetyltransferase
MTLLEERPPTVLQKPSVSVLKTERLVLRAPRPDDAKAVAALLNDLSVAQNTTTVPHPYTLADAEEWLAVVNTAEGEVTFAVTLADGTIIGACGISACKGGSEIGYWFGVAFWGHGYATEAARALVDHAFGHLRYDALLARARISNPASRRVLEKCGFQWTGIGLYRIRAIASSAPLDLFRLDRGLWTSLKSWGAVQRAV